ncbi:MAG: hypothetical protein RLZZ501_2445, partial [Pseudomonadota bacterium]
LADPALYQGPAARLTELQRRDADLTRRLEQAEAAWFEAQEAWEAAQGA